MSRRASAPAPAPAGRRVHLELSGVAYGGEAIGRAEGQVVFVPYGLPGEEVEVELVEDKGDYARGVIVELIKASPERAEPPCPYFGTCGGCQWQHAAYPAQLRYKRQIVAEQLRRIGAFEDAARYVLPTIGMQEPWHYRNHARFTVGRRFGELCFTRAGTRRLLRIDHCRLMHPRINETLAQLQGRFTGFRAHQIAIRVGANTGEQLVNPRLDPAPDVPSGQTELHEELLGRRFRIASPAFFQVNTRRERRDAPTGATRFAELIPADGLSIAETLILVVLDLLDPQLEDVFVDAYCGVGTFSALMAPYAREVIGIEESSAAIEDARANCADLSNVRFIQGKTEELLPKLEERVDKVILDPARVGCERAVLDALLEARPRRIVYVSCDPSTLARDLAILRQGGFTLHSVQPIDMFPQTYHVESVSLLTC
ncbi:MAG TPA: class I SAM-dependent RNA methyltransferase [Chloroflexota bacterium]|nr:class I SAM-dependent RNA methyltransferase [Chloroflexota bacterium]